MFVPFEEEKALLICNKLMKLLDDGTLFLERNREESSERKNAGIMIGVMVCNAKKIKNKTNCISDIQSCSMFQTEEIVLAACSGTSRHIKNKNQILSSENITSDQSEVFYDSQTGQKIIFVQDIVSSEQINKALLPHDKQIHQITDILNKDKVSHTLTKEERANLIQKRKTFTTESLSKVHELYRFYCKDHYKGFVNVSLLDICRKKHAEKGRFDTKPPLPPTGTGECSAPKLLNYAIKYGLTPISMAEIFYSAPDSPDNSMRGKKFAPCDERCGLILPSMLGLEILYRDKDIIVVNKQSGVLSVPGRGEDKQDCIVNRVKSLFPDCMEQPSVHRLDMETSGLLVLAFNKDSHRALNRQFEEGSVQKKYTALLDGILAKKNIPEEGQNELYFRLDIDNRPHQIWDTVYGKKAVTQWKTEGVQNYTAPDGTVRPVTRVTFTPLTGRTHQLRLASADSHGFGTPIIGDTLYGKCNPGERLLLHACYLSFTHPATGQRMEFSCPAPF